MFLELENDQVINSKMIVRAHVFKKVEGSLICPASVNVEMTSGTIVIVKECKSNEEAKLELKAFVEILEALETI